MYRKKLHIHFIGIGGIGMSGIAKILRYQGYTISGCDADVHQKSVVDLRDIGCTIFEGNNTTSCADNTIDIVVYSSAIRADNPEIVHAQERGIATIRRALMLAELMRTKHSIAVAGMHGKTTTTSLISHILIESKQDPTVIIGGHLTNISTNARFGNGDFLVAEADESDRSLLSLQATIAIITNIDLEHLETYRDLDDIKATFVQFLNNLPFYGKAIICIDDPQIQSILPMNHIKFIKYGISSDAELSASDIQLEAQYSTFVVHKHGIELGTIQLPMPGIHNVRNCLAAIATALELEVSFEQIQAACHSFKGVDRRFTYKGLYKNALVFDDYGHHPEEIKHTIAVARKRCANKLTVVFQPHRYTRTQKLWDAFIDMFVQNPVDTLIITDIYPASEEPIHGITSELFVHELRKRNPSFPVHYITEKEQFASIINTLDAIIQPNDLILLQGAGKITYLAKYLPK